MKKYFRIICFISLIFSYVSCDQFLNTESPSKFTEDVVFTSIDYAERAVLGIYYLMGTPDFYELEMMMYMATDSDIEFAGGGDDANKRSLARYQGNEGFRYTLQPWVLFYEGIERANLCIDNLGPESPLWNSEYSLQTQRLYGEAVTLRALFYFELMRIWGDVPWAGESFKDGMPFFKRKTDRDSIYEVLIEDLRVAQQYVPWMRELGTVERIGKGYVKGLLSQMALTYSGFSLRNKTFKTERGEKWQEYYAIARDECWDLMQSGQHALNPDFEGIFRTMHEYSMDLTHGENLFELAFGRGYSGRWGYTVGMPFHSSNRKYGYAAPGPRTTPYMYYSYDRKDLRRDVSVALYNYNNSTIEQQRLISGDGTNFNHTKWRRSWLVPRMGDGEATSIYLGVNFPMMRFANVVLMFAEAENEVEGYPTQRAQDALKMVRRRAFSEEDHPEKVDAYVEAVSKSKDNFFNAIVDERAWEFCGEYIRKFDLVRWNLLGEKIELAKTESWKIMNNHEDYRDLVPYYIYWKPDPNDNEILLIHNRDFREDRDMRTAENGSWERSTWLMGASESSRNNFRTVIDRVASGYDPSKNNHLFPIYISIIEDSRGYLENDQMPK